MPQEPKLVRRLSLLDSILLLAGGIIGSGIFLTAQDIANNTRTPLLFFSVWGLGIVITLLACFAFAELGAMFPDAGGQYIYMREAYGKFVAFLYGWMVFTASSGGSIGALAAGFALYLGSAIPALDASHVALTLGRIAFHGHDIALNVTRGNLLAIAAIALLTLVNIFGVRAGALMQNIATWIKFASIVAFVGLGIAVGHGSWGHYSSSLARSAGSPSLLAGVGVALIAVFFALDGWVYITWVAGEVKDPQRNLPRSLIWGLVLVGAIYLAINAVYLYALPMAGIGATPTVVQSAGASLFSPAAGSWLALMIAISCFGAMACCILTGARVFYAMAEDGIFFRSLAQVHPRWRTPVMSLALQGAWAGALTLFLGYADLFTYAIFMLVLGYVMTVAALFILRRKMPQAKRPYRCFGYPWTPMLYVMVGTAWAINTVAQKPKDSLIGIVIVAAGAPLYFYWRRNKKDAVIAENAFLESRTQ